MKFFHKKALLTAALSLFSTSAFADLNPPNLDLPNFIQPCEKITVNVVKPTQTECTDTECGLDAAIALANNCSTGVTINFKAGLSADLTIDLNALGFTLPFQITGNHIVIDAKSSDAEAVSNRLNLKAVPGKAVFEISGDGNQIKGLLFKDETVPPIVIDANAKNTDFFDIQTSSQSFENKANDNLDQPLFFVRPYTSDTYSVYALLPTGSEVRFYNTTDGSSTDLIRENLIASPLGVGKPLEMSPVVDVAGNVIDDTRTIYAGLISMSSIPIGTFVIPVIKSPGKNVYIPKNTSLSGGVPFFKDNDFDGLPNSFEDQIKSNSNLSDSDSDGCFDYNEAIDQATGSTNNVPRVKNNAGVLEWIGFYSNAANLKPDVLDVNVKNPVNCSSASNPDASVGLSKGGCSLREGVAPSVSNMTMVFALLGLGFFWKRRQVNSILSPSRTF